MFDYFARAGLPRSRRSIFSVGCLAFLAATGYAHELALIVEVLPEYRISSLDLALPRTDLAWLITGTIVP